MATQVRRLMESVRYEEAATAQGIRLINYDKQRRPFRHTLRVTPVRCRSLDGGARPPAAEGHRLARPGAPAPRREALGCSACGRPAPLHLPRCLRAR